MATPSPSAFDPRAFEGTAEYYAIGRPPYSAQLADTMARELSLDGTGQLLDVGCGPGVLELPLARLFDQVTALDPEPGMLQAGQRRCQQAGVANVRWLRGVAEDTAALNLGPQRAVTFGQSFHRVRRLEVAEAVYDLLVPRGSLILISHNADDGRPRPAGPGHPVRRLAHRLRVWAPRPDHRHRHRRGQLLLAVVRRAPMVREPPSRLRVRPASPAARVFARRSLLGLAR